MCTKWVKEHFEEIPSWVMNIILIGAIFYILALRFFNKFPGNDIQLLQILAILFGTLVVGNSITQYRSKTVQNELNRSNIDIINHCITNKKLIIETYNAVLSVKHQSDAIKEADKALPKEETERAKEEAYRALKDYLEFCEKLKKGCNTTDVSDKSIHIVDKTFEEALKVLKKQICPDKNK